MRLRLSCCLGTGLVTILDCSKSPTIILKQGQEIEVSITRAVTGKRTKLNPVTDNGLMR